jgi:hypothetical protein
MAANATRLGVRNPGNTDRRRTIAGGVRQHHGRLESGYQTLVAVRGRVGDGVDGLRVLDDAADVEQGQLGQTAILVAGEQGLAVLLQGLVDVHAAAVVTDQGLGHESRSLAVAVRHIEYRVLQNLHLVSLGHQTAGTDTDFALAARGDFVVVHFHYQTHFLEGIAHGRTDVLEGIDRRHRKVPPLDGRAVTLVALDIILAGVPGALL